MNNQKSVLHKIYSKGIKELTMKKAAVKKPRPSCPQCGNHTVYYRKFTDSFMCRACGTPFRWNKLTNKAYPYRLLKVE